MHETRATACPDAGAWEPVAGRLCLLRSPEGHRLPARIIEVGPELVRVWPRRQFRPLWVPRGEVQEFE